MNPMHRISLVSAVAAHFHSITLVTVFYKAQHRHHTRRFQLIPEQSSVRNRIADRPPIISLLLLNAADTQLHNRICLANHFVIVHCFHLPHLRSLIVLEVVRVDGFSL